MTNITKKRSKYKYLILERLKALPVTDYTRAKTELPQILGKSADTFHQWLYIPLESNRTIPADSFALIADYLGVSMESLFNRDKTGLHIN